MIHIMKTILLPTLLFITFTSYAQSNNEFISINKEINNEVIIFQDTVTADFIADPMKGVFPLTVIFTNKSLNATEYNWNFGDGSTSSEASPMHTYNSPGDYSVSLVASNPSFIDTLTKANYITVDWPTPIADFSAQPFNGVDPLMVIFTDFSKDAHTWLWNFGDGTNSILQHPTHIYKKGTYSVSLFVTNPSGTHFIMKPDLITVDPNSVAEKLKASIKMFPNPTSTSVTIEFVNENYKLVEISLFDLDGKLLECENPTLNSVIIQELNLTNLPSGNYLLQLRIDDEKLALNLVKK